MAGPAPAGNAASHEDDCTAGKLACRMGRVRSENRLGESAAQGTYKHAAACRNLNFFSDRPFIVYRARSAEESSFSMVVPSIG